MNDICVIRFESFWGLDLQLGSFAVGTGNKSRADASLSRNPSCS